MIMQTSSSGEPPINLSSSDDYPSPPANRKGNGPNSPTDVRSYPSENISYEEDEHLEIGDDEEEDFNNISARLGDLPIVREGSILDEEDDNHILMSGGMAEEYEEGDVEYEEEMRDAYLQYEKEQEEMKREMNLNKVAFAAYRAAVLHLVHNQTHEKKLGSADVDEKKGEDCSQSASMEENDTDTVNTYDEANERMVLLEEKAREIVENKAKAFRDALEVHADFEKRREEKRHRQRMLLGGLAGIGGGKDNMLTEFRKLKKAKTAAKTNTTAKAPETLKPVHATAKPSTSSKPVSRPKPQPTKTSSSTLQRTKARKKSAPSGPNVRLKTKPTRHANCIKHTLPKFQYKNNDNPQHEDGNDTSESQPAKYRTTAWIRGMVQWRIQRFHYEELALKKCGCPDCTVDLKSLYEKQKNSTTLRQ
jgi:hypothetical protein